MSISRKRDGKFLMRSTKGILDIFEKFIHLGQSSLVLVFQQLIFLN